jgi:hypothetical protein
MTNPAALLALLVAASAPLPAPAQAAPPDATPPAGAPGEDGGDPWADEATAEPSRPRWYVGGGLGYGDGSVSWAGEGWSLGRDMGASPSRFAFALEGGWQLATRLRVGLDLTWLRASGSRSGVNATVDLLQPGVAAAFYPFERGLFVRAAVGYARLESGYDAPWVHRSETHDGVGLTGGLGYALAVGRVLDVFARIEVTRQWYGSTPERIDNATLWAAYGGVLWF